MCGGLFGVFFGEGLVHAHEHGDAGGFAFELGGVFVEAVGGCHGLVVADMGLAQFRWHGTLVIKIGKAGIGIQGTGIQNALGGFLDFRLLRFCWRWPWEVIVDDVFGIAVVAFQSSCNSSHPCHMNVGGKNAEVIYICIRNNKI